MDVPYLTLVSHRRVNARRLLCFWAVRGLGMSLTDLARELDMTTPGVGFAAERGGVIAHDNKYQLME